MQAGAGHAIWGGMTETTYRVVQTSEGFEVEFTEDNDPRAQSGFKTEAEAKVWITHHKRMDETGRRWERHAHSIARLRRPAALGKRA